MGGSPAGFSGQIVGGSSGAMPIGGTGGSAATGGSGGTTLDAGAAGESVTTDGGGVGGRLNTSAHGAYADHLLSFRDYMESNGVPIYAISVQNEPDIDVDYESCYWNSSEFITWLNGQGSRFGNTKLIVAESFNFNMAANFSAYIWWYIRRSYGPITEDGNVSKRGYLMAQYAKFVRPDFVRVNASNPSNSNVYVTAYKRDDQVVIVAVNTNSSSQTITLDIKNGCVESFSRYTTSGSKNLSDDGPVALSDNSVTVTLDAQSVTTFVSSGSS